MSDAQKNIVGMLGGLALGALGFYLIYHVLLPMAHFSIPDFPEDWYVFVLPLLLPTISGFQLGWDLSTDAGDIFRYLGIMLLAILAANLANLLVGFLIGLFLTFATGTFLDYGIIALILGLVGAPTVYVIHFFFGE